MITRILKEFSYKVSAPLVFGNNDSIWLLFDFRKFCLVLFSSLRLYSDSVSCAPKNIQDKTYGSLFCNRVKYFDSKSSCIYIAKYNYY